MKVITIHIDLLIIDIGFSYPQFCLRLPSSVIIILEAKNNYLQMFYKVKAKMDYISDDLLWIKKPKTSCKHMQFQRTLSTHWYRLNLKSSPSYRDFITKTYFKNAEMSVLYSCVSLLQCYSLSFGNQHRFCTVPHTTVVLKSFSLFSNEC